MRSNEQRTQQSRICSSVGKLPASFFLIICHSERVKESIPFCRFKTSEKSLERSLPSDHFLPSIKGISRRAAPLKRRKTPSLEMTER
jgi:hypothetical protein